MAEGFTRVAGLSFRDTAYCALGAGASGSGSPAGSCTCCKLSDSAINALAPGKVYYSKVAGYPSTYTKYSGAMAVNAQPGLIMQGASYAAVKDVTPTYTPGYGGFIFAHSNDW